MHSWFTQAPVAARRGDKTGMYSDLNLLEAREQFDTARHRAFWRAVGRVPGRYHTLRLPALNRVLTAARFETQSSRGVQEIHLDKVVGTVTKAKQIDFASEFQPLASG